MLDNVRIIITVSKLFLEKSPYGSMFTNNLGSHQHCSCKRQMFLKVLRKKSVEKQVIKSRGIVLVSNGCCNKPTCKLTYNNIDLLFYSSWDRNPKLRSAGSCSLWNLKEKDAFLPLTACARPRCPLDCGSINSTLCSIFMWPSLFMLSHVFLYTSVSLSRFLLFIMTTVLLDWAQT